MTSSPNISLLRQVIRQLRYRPLFDLIGQSVTVNSLATLEGDLQRAVAGNWLKDGKLIDNPRRPITVMRYGLLDLEFIGPQSLLDTQFQTGIPLLKELGFILDPEQAKEFAEFAKPMGDEYPDDPTCLTLLVEELAQNETILKLFLQSDRIGLKEWRGSYAKPSIWPTLLLGYFPRTFVIKDACVTNSGFVWLHKHFYF